MLTIENLSGGYSGDPILRNVSFKVNKGQLFGILGPNGSGKTTLLKMISGIIEFKSGSILIKDKPISSYATRELAKTVAVLPQHSSEVFAYSVKDTVSLGRYAHQQGWFQTWNEEDEAIVQRVMKQTGVDSFQDHHLSELSGGERQRVYLAQALAQQPEMLLLDEPTNHLDLSYQKDLLDLLRKMAKEEDLTVISIFHDLNLAGLYCDRLLLLNNGEVSINDIPNEVLQEDRIQAVYGTAVKKHPHPNVPKPQMLMIPELDSDGQLNIEIDERFLKISDEMIELHAPAPLRTMSSGVTGAGTGWYQNFINRHVNQDYNCSDHREEMAQFLKKNGYEPGETVGMMTAVNLADAAYRLFKDDGLSVFIVVTAGAGNAIDASQSERHSYEIVQPGTINIWVFINGTLSEEAFIQALMTATEAKVKGLQNEQVYDRLTGTLATGSSTDSIMIAASQRGKLQEFGGTITPLGKLVGKGVYECTVEALQKYQGRLER
ncbi:ABC transporter ATP-binding protein [Bacillus canaveralius]|uniref:ABC transporter ATP-binding protein n=1 Tax=Bacillus canaveralius TaxID=1403243 RepID=A0A2N5GS11_9BACI|nr:adenosylcobinamide amidohydrolase [Bacillus canaveralius]PLR86316.1 ABC transporter ATP-binding protein [Bacillus canaveralius]PLR98549.1 ABC transporter ATP-binding protein [Bacillus canaveralius]